MMLSVPDNDKIKEALLKGDLDVLDGLFTESSRLKGKQDRLLIQRNINSLIVKCAFQKNNPDLLSTLHVIPPADAEEIISLVLKHYISTRDARWYTALVGIPVKLGKKSLQSHMISVIARTLITEGISLSDPEYIEQGLAELNKITFRKYRSDTLIECIPGLTRWVVSCDNLPLLYRLRDLIEGISDISKRAVLHADVAQAIAAIAIHKKDPKLFLESIHCASSIHQKLRRKECLAVIINSGVKSAFGKELLDIRRFSRNLQALPEEVQGELVSALTKQLLDHTKNKDLINENLDYLCKTLPFTSELVIQNLLLKAGRSGDEWYLSDAIAFLKYLPSRENYPVRELVRSGIAISRHSQSPRVLLNLVPFIEKNCSPVAASRVYLQFSQILLLLGDFENASQLFGKIPVPSDNPAQYTNCMTRLLVEGVFHDRNTSQLKDILRTAEQSVSFEAIDQSVHQISHNTPFIEIVKHSSSLKQLLLLDGGYDKRILGFITVLISRGFLESCNSSFLVDLAKSVQDLTIREQAISAIYVKLAEIGVMSGNRDLLQQSVGIACLIQGESTRSATLSSIIDDAARLAASQGDLDLLLRMRIWTSTLQDPGLVAYAMTNIIDGVIKYAVGRHAPDALDEAYHIAQEIEDPSLRMQLCERIAESFVRIGCDQIRDASSRNITLPQETVLKPFEKGLQLLKAEIKNPRISLKIAGIIDIILSTAKKSAGTEYILPLVMYAIEIENPLERTAMMSRIVSNLNENLVHPDSADPYEVLAYILGRHYPLQASHQGIGLVCRLINLTRDPFVRLQYLNNLAGTVNQLNDTAQAQKLLEAVFAGIPDLPFEYQKTLILTDLATGYRQIDPKKAEHCLLLAVDKLKGVESEKNAVVRLHIVHALVRTKGIIPENKRMGLVSDVISGVSDPIEYVKALVSAYSIVREDKKWCKSATVQIFETIEKIESSYDQALLILEVVPLMAQDCEEEFPLKMVKKAESLLKTVNILHIADTIRDEIARVLFDLSKGQKNSPYLKKSIEILKLIDDDYLRQYRLSRLGYEDSPEKNAQYAKILTLSDRILHEGCQPAQITSLERSVRSLTERRKRAFVFCRLSILFLDKGDQKNATRMLNNAIKESDIIRPLSKRAYVRCDMAMKMSAAGYDTTAQEILDGAIDAATNIRQSALRDTVFNELGLAIRVMQGGHE